MAGARPSVLVVEDNRLIAADLAMAVEACGCAVVGPMTAVAEGLALLERQRPDGALLDVALGAEWVWPLADRLAACGIPFVFVSAYGVAEFPPRFRQHPRLMKPATLDALADALRRIGIVPG